MTDKERAAEYLKRSEEARREARCVMDLAVREGFLRVGDEYERMSAAVLNAIPSARGALSISRDLSFK
jgi:hypothetical protein